MVKLYSLKLEQKTNYIITSVHYFFKRYKQWEHHTLFIIILVLLLWHIHLFESFNT
jgi:hypothetical protein